MLQSTRQTLPARLIPGLEITNMSIGLAASAQLSIRQLRRLYEFTGCGRVGYLLELSTTSRSKSLLQPTVITSFVSCDTPNNFLTRPLTRGADGRDSEKVVSKLSAQRASHHECRRLLLCGSGAECQRVFHSVLPSLTCSTRGVIRRQDALRGHHTTWIGRL